MLFDSDESPIQSDSYIEALLDGHARRPMQVFTGSRQPAPGIRHVIRVLERGLPRFHPSFLFEERLAAELRSAAATANAGAVAPGFAVDRRVVMGGAIASSVSLAGAAVLAWRRRRY